MRVSRRKIKLQRRILKLRKNFSHVLRDFRIGQAGTACAELRPSRGKRTGMRDELSYPDGTLILAGRLVSA